METEEDAAALRAISRVGAMICIEALNPVALLYHRANGSDFVGTPKESDTSAIKTQMRPGSTLARSRLSPTSIPFGTPYFRTCKDSHGEPVEINPFSPSLRSSQIAASSLK